jgi:hypothetical protein
MTTGREHVLMLSGVMLAGILLVLGLQPYSVTSPWSRFDGPGRKYVEAALRQDTAALRNLSASSAPIRWAILVRQTDPAALATWANWAHASVGFTRGDTTDVWYDTPTSACPFRLTFVRDHSAKVVDAHARCYFKRGWPTDSTAIDVSH